MTNTVFITLLGLGASLVHLLGVLHAGFAIMKSRTAQGATAWAISLVTFPYLALPLYWIFGRNKFQGYVLARRTGDKNLIHLPKELEEKCNKYRVTFDDARSSAHALEALAKLPFVGSNDAQVLIDGEQTFDSIFDAIKSAKKYVLIQFFIIKNDELGQRFKQLLVDRARDGISIYFMYDAVGSYELPNNYIDDLRLAGVKTCPFGSTERRNRFQINFRNHRKVVLVDGEVALTGGLNVGDEYLGKSKKFGHWRDTHMALRGPAVLSIQLSFVEDWSWAAGEILNLNWDPLPTENNLPVLVLPTGPADELDTCELFFVHALNSARRRIWITTPYFVPSGAVISALQLAALRGVDVRLMLPENPDHYLVYMASFSYLARTEPYGIKVFKYQKGFLHQKTMLVDDDVAAIGSANFDNRSFRLNFELTALVVDHKFASQVEEMLNEDFKNCRRYHASELNSRSVWFRWTAKAARLLSPVL